MKHFFSTPSAIGKTLVRRGFRPFFWLMLLVSPLAMSFRSGHYTNSDAGLSKEIRINKGEILRLFSLKANDKFSLQLRIDKVQIPPVEISIINHINPGEKSGAIAAHLVLEKAKSRLLINRKDRKEGLVYWMAILPDQGDVAYKLKQETKDEFVLVEVPKNEVITD